MSRSGRPSSSRRNLLPPPHPNPLPPKLPPPTPLPQSPHSMADVLRIRHPAASPTSEITMYDDTVHTTPYNLEIRVRLISLFMDTAYNKSLGVLHGPVDGHEWSPTTPGPMLVELDAEPDSDDSDASVVPGGGQKILVLPKHVEVVGKVEQRKGLLLLVQHNELRYDVLRAMVAAGCSTVEKYPDVENGNILFFPAFSGSKEHLRVLIQLGANVSVKNDDG